MPRGPGIFALFCTSNISLEASQQTYQFVDRLTRTLQKINDILTTAERGASDANHDGWYYWLATECLPEGGKGDITTKPPVQEMPTAYLGKDYEALSATLTHIDADQRINHAYFAVLDERTQEDGSVVICNTVNDDGSVDAVRISAKESSLRLIGLDVVCISWDEVESARDAYVRKGKGDVLD